MRGSTNSQRTSFQTSSRVSSHTSRKVSLSRMFMKFRMRMKMGKIENHIDYVLFSETDCLLWNEFEIALLRNIFSIHIYWFWNKLVKIKYIHFENKKM